MEESMLTEAFNKTVDYQKYAQDILREKVEHQRQTEHNYGMSGQIDKIGRIATTNTQDHLSSHALIKKQKKEKEDLRNIMLMQALRKDMQDILDRMDAILRDMREQMRKMRHGLKALESDDAAVMIAFLIEEYPDEYDHKTLQKMTFEEIERAVQEEVLTAEERYQMFKNKYKALAEKYDQKIKDNPALKEKLTAEFAEREKQIQTEVEALGKGFREIRNEVGYALGKSNETSNHIRGQKNKDFENEMSEDDFFTSAPDLTSEFEQAASGDTSKIEREAGIEQSQNPPPPLNTPVP